MEHARHASEVIIPPLISLAPGTKLGPYEIISVLGVGGMGEVYRARDSKLGRDIAIKVAAIYGFEDSTGVRAVVMELVEGPALSDLIVGAPIPAAEVLLIATQICDAPEYARDRGVVHRDLKPANVKITPDGTVKLLDFGLAKALDAQACSADISTSPTITNMATQAGIILGTPAYMSPEQAKGRPVDRRARPCRTSSITIRA
jgi:eukaryotic-like serine/threonine-protein kinase